MTADLPPDDEDQGGPGEFASRWFPYKHASGDAFLERRDEHRRLVDGVLTGTNYWFDAPVRYGVGSLVARVTGLLRFNNHPRVTSARCDFRQVYDQRSFAEAILTAFGQLAAQAMRRPNVTEENVSQLFPGITKSIYFDDRFLQTIRFLPEDDPVQACLQIAPQLEELATASGCRNILHVTDLQQLRALARSERLHGVLAELVTATGSTAWLLQGSNQNYMRSLMGEQDGKLASQFRRFRLPTISVKGYLQYLGNAAQARWNCNLGRKATKMILALPRRHTFWMNELCRHLWVAELPPLIQNVVEGWNSVVQQQRHSLTRQLEQLSSNQRAVFVNLAHHPTARPRAKAFVERTGVSSASVGQAITILVREDLLCCDNDDIWKIKDPAMQWLLCRPQQMIDDICDGRPVEL